MGTHPSRGRANWCSSEAAQGNPALRLAGFALYTAY